jgi:hypothetical protein
MREDHAPSDMADEGFPDDIDQFEYCYLLHPHFAELNQKEFHLECWCGRSYCMSRRAFDCLMDLVDIRLREKGDTP